MNLFSLGRFTNLGYLASSRRFAPLDVSMDGRTVVVTGATAGLGQEAARSLAGLGARVILVGRNPAKTRRVAAEIREAIGADIDYRIADLSLMTAVAGLAHDLLETESRLDVLINNAGVLVNERQTTSEGNELTLATNLLGHFLLTNLLLPRLIESAPARIINVSSGGMYSQRIAVDDLQFAAGDYTGTAAYARTKRGQVILTEMWAECLAERGVVVNSMHPGWARTPGVAESLPAFNKIMRPLLRTPAQGADTIVWLAASPEAGLLNGKFLLDREPQPTHLIDHTRESPEERRLLWDRLDALVAPALA